MKGNRRAVIGLLCMAGMIGAVATYKAAAIVISHTQHAKIAYHFDNRLSYDTQNKIVQHVDQCVHSSPQELITDIHTTFDCVQKIALQYEPDGAQMVISAHDILALINNHFLVTPSRNLIAKEWYNAAAVAAVKCMDVSLLSERQLPDAIYAWIDRMPESLFHTFNVTWIDENSIELRHAQDPQLTIVCAHAQPIETVLLDSCIEQKAILLSNRQIRKGDSILADVRFDQQIILSKK